MPALLTNRLNQVVSLGRADDGSGHVVLMRDPGVGDLRHRIPYVLRDLLDSSVDLLAGFRLDVDESVERGIGSASSSGRAGLAERAGED